MFEELKETEKNKMHEPQPHWFGGLFMIAMGILFFLPTLGIISWRYVGMAFAFLPAFWIVSRGWSTYRQTGELNGAVITQLMWGLFPFMFIALAFAGVNMGLVWPLILIFIGITILFSRGGKA